MTKKRGFWGRVVLSVIFSLVMIASLTLPAFASGAEQTMVTPRSNYIGGADVSLSFNGTSAIARGSARLQNGAETLDGTLYVYWWNGSKWVYLDDASGSVTSGQLVVSVYFEAESGVLYRAAFTVGANGEEEMVSVEDESTCP